MQAAQMIANSAPLVVNDIEAPRPRAGEVIVKVARCGLCHTDLHLHEGSFGLGGGKQLHLKQSLPLTMGHEIQGTVHALGDGVTGLAVGTQVAVYPWIGCGSCGTCDGGLEHLCARAQALGVNVNGGYAEYVSVPAARYVLPIEDLDPDQAALLMCSGISTYSALGKLASAFERGRVAIIGFGGLGQMALQIARELYGQTPLVLDIAVDKLARARSMGAEAFDIRDDGIGRTIKKATGGVAGVVDFVGSETTSEIAGQICGQAGHIVVVGLFGGMLKTPLPLLPLRGMTIEGSYVGTLEDARALLALARKGALEPIPVEHCTLHELNDAFAQVGAGSVTGRVIVKL